MIDRLVPAAAAALLIALAPPVAAQAPQPAPGKSAAAARPAAKPTAKAARPAAKGKRLDPSAQKAVEEVTPIDDDPGIRISEDDLKVASQVYVGEMPCELGASVRVRAARRTGLFVVSTKGHRFLMHPVHSRTGAIRLEDSRRGAMWLQLGNKSMLMSQKLGQRLADECQSPEQVTYAEELKRNPRPSLLEPMPHGGHPGGMPCCAPQQPAGAPATATAAQPSPPASAPLAVPAVAATEAAPPPAPAASESTAPIPAAAASAPTPN
ncbi:hypothetical protein [Ramlibacter sp.]|uniref:hypothetical protein n=1 Tax=Ramlibacter sp. TaxID=1917967 RepID=UPI002FCAD962